MAESRTRWVASLALAAALLYVCWLIAAPFLRVLLWAAVLAVVSRPLHTRLRRWVHSSGLAAALTTLAVLVAFLVPVFLIGSVLLKEATNLAPSLEGAIRSLPNRTTPWVRWVDRYVDIDPYLDPDSLRQKARQIGSLVVAATVATIGSLAVVLGQALLALFTLFYLLRDGEQIGAAITAMLPVPPQRARLLMTRCRDVIMASLLGVLLIAAVQGALGTIGLIVLQVPSPITWGVIMFLCAMVPIGPALVWIPAAIFLAATGHEVRAIIMLAWGICIVGPMDNLLRPVLVGKRTQLHELLVFFSVLGGLAVFGILGIIVGPVVVAMTISVFQVLFLSDSEGQRPDASAGDADDGPVVASGVHG